MSHEVRLLRDYLDVGHKGAEDIGRKARLIRENKEV